MICGKHLGGMGMKKILAVLMCFTIMAGCGASAPSSEVTPSAVSQEAASSEQPEQQPAPDAQGEPQTDAVRVVSLKGPTAMGLAKLSADEGDSGKYQFALAASPDEITPQLVQGNVDIAAVPANLAAVLYNKTEGQVRVLAVNTLGVLYIVENGDSVKSVEDLRGKTIYASGKGATPEYALNHVLAANGIDPQTDVTIEWKSEHTECAAALATAENAIAMLPQPFVTTAQAKNDKIRVALDLNELWESSSLDAGGLITGVAVARAEFVDANPEKVAEFLDEYKSSVEFTKTNVAETAQIIVDSGILPSVEIAQKALPQCSITFIEGGEMKQKLSGYLKVLFEQNPQSVGGAAPDDAFYFSRA